MRSIILCVDDEWDVLKSLGNQLKRYFGKDYDIELADGGEDALSLCTELTAEGKNLALIISDQRMSDMAGDTLLIHLHALYPKTLKIMLTGQADADAVGNVVNRAALYRYIRKPWDETDLLLTVSEALRRFQQEQQLIEQNELLKKTNTRLENSLLLLLSTLEATADGILVLDNAGEIVSFNQKLLSIWSLVDIDSTSPEGNLVAGILRQLVEPDVSDFKALFYIKDIEKHDFFRLDNGRIIEYYLRPQRLGGNIVGRVWSFRDVTQEKQAEAMIQYQALHDPLTNLPNRMLFNQNLAAALQQAVEKGESFAVLFLDLDRFKEVNDTLGHSMGDRLLLNAVQRLSRCLRDTDVLARWGGDEFVLLLSNLRSQSDASEVAQRLIEVLQPPFMLEGHPISITASVGIAMYPQGGLDGHTLLQAADMALYKAKRSGRNNYQHWDSSDRPNSTVA